MAGSLLLPAVMAAQFPADYQGTPFKEIHSVPGIIEAEDFDNGGEGVSWHDSTPTGQGSSYRPDCNVDIERTYSIGFTENGEWLNYTINVAQDGAYAVRTYSCSPNANGSFHIEIDGKVVTRAVKAPVVSDWGDFSRYAEATIQLTAGKHLFRWYTYGGMNLDKFEFVRTGEYNPSDIPGNFNYPVTKPSSNPLFVNFDSPMYGSDGIGSMYTADPSAHVWADGRLYVYASHDMEPAQGCDRMDRYHIFSTDDMVNWTDHGEILNSSQVSWGRPEGGFMWAPDCAFKDGTYYFYFPHPSGSDWNNTWKIGVATSTDPASGFEVQGYIEGAPTHIDPCVFVDDDGQAYIYNGGGNHCFGGKLKANMTELDGDMKPMEGLEDFHEGTWIHKYNGRYYLSYADNNGTDGNQLRYAVSDSPLGPWTSKGVYLYPTGCDTSHGSIVEYKGKWYAFYHASNYSGVGQLRSVCFDELTYDSNGNILPVRNWGTPYGGTAIAINDQGATFEAEDYNEGGYHTAYFKTSRTIASHSNGRGDDDVEIDRDGDRTYVKSLGRGEWLRYSGEVETSGLYDITFNVRGSGEPRFHLSLNGSDMTGDISPDGAWNTHTVTGVRFAASTEYLDLRVSNGLVDIDNILIQPSEPYKGTPYTDHSIPGIIRVEHFDRGGEGIAYYNGTTDNQNKISGVRDDDADGYVDFEKSGDDVNLCWMNENKWFKYTFDCKEAGMYTIKVNVSFQDNGTGSVKITHEDNQYVSDNYTGNGWGNYEYVSFPQRAYFPAGKNTIEMRTGLNVRHLSFEKDKSTGIATIPGSTDSAVVRGGTGTVSISAYQGPITIHTIDGTTVYNSLAAPSSIALPAGIYLVKLTTRTFKVIVR